MTQRKTQRADARGGGQTNITLLKVFLLNKPFILKSSLTHTQLCPSRDTNVRAHWIQSQHLPLDWEHAMNHGIDDAPLQGDK